MKLTKEGIKNFVFQQKCIPWKVRLFFEGLVVAIKDMTGTLYDNKFFDAEHRKELPEKTVKPIVTSLLREFKPRSVVDVGCGDGLYLEEFKRQGISDLFGCDYSPEGVRRCKEKGIPVMRFNVVTDQFTPSRRFDLCVCFEIAEHIPTSASNKLIQMLTQNSDTIVFTAAYPGQGGHNHVNEQPKEFWHGIFSDNGYELDEPLSKQLRSSWAEQGVVWYMHTNLMIFRKKK